MYMNIFTCKEDIVEEFDLLKDALDDCEILLAVYSYEDYSGSAFVLFEKDDLLYEVNGSHCSCYGLEGQWQPEIALVKELYHRVTEGTLGRGDYSSGDNGFSKELLAILEDRFGIF